MTAIHALITYANNQPSGSINQKIAQIILANLEDACTLSIEQMAERCFTSPTTLTRLARTLGYKGYADFRTQLEQVVHNYEFYALVLPQLPTSEEDLWPSYQNAVVELMSQFETMYDAAYYEKICDAMYESEKILIFLGRLQSGASIALQADLAISGKTCLRATSIEAEMQMLEELTPRSMVILRADTLNTGKNVLGKILDGVQSRGAKLMVLGSKQNFVLRNNADFFCEYPRNGTILDTFTQDTVLSLLTMIYRTKYISH